MVRPVSLPYRLSYSVAIAAGVVLQALGCSEVHVTQVLRGEGL
jgi:hypothetical protein